MLRSGKYWLLPALLLVLALLGFAATGCGSESNGDTGAPDPGPGLDEPGDDDREAEAPLEEVDGKDPELPVYPGSIRIYYSELTPDTFVVDYIAPAPLGAVIEYYQEQFTGWEDILAGEDTDGGGYTFETSGAESPDKAFIITLDQQGQDKTLIILMAAAGYFE
jgi:hypothetical protein